MLKAMSDIEVVGLSYYPIKSCGATVAEEVGLNEYGINFDREWMLVGNNGQPITQRTNPELALVRPRLEVGHLVLAAPGMSEVSVPLDYDPDAEVVPVNLWKKPGTGTNEGLEAAGFFSDYVKKPVRLIRIAQPRQIKPECQVDGASTRTAFADGFPILLTSLDSLAEFNSNLAKPVTMDRFRSNIIVEGAPAYDEDYWREVCIGNLRAFVVRVCGRCPMPNIDQNVGVLTKERPVTEALRSTRRGVDPVNGDTSEFFGQNLTHAFGPGVKVKVGDKLQVIVRADERNWRQAA